MYSCKKIAIIITICLVWLPNVYSQLNPYLGLTPPDSIPIRFGSAAYQANSEWWWHGAPEFSQDGMEMFFTKYRSNMEPLAIKMFCLNQYSGSWTTPQATAFFENSSDCNPVFSRNGSKLYFMSNQNGNEKIYTVKKTASGWSQPLLLNIPYQSMSGMLGTDMSITRDSTIYFTLHDMVNGPAIYRIKCLNGTYIQADKLPAEITSFPCFSPYIDPDEKYIMFCSLRNNNFDIYISFKKPDNGWTIAQNMGNLINGTAEDCYPWVSYDGKYLFFNSVKSGDLGPNCYWVDAKIINRYNPFTTISGDNSTIPIEIELYQNYPNPFNPTTTIKFSINQKQFAQISIYNVKGELVAELANKLYEPGLHEVEFVTSGLNSGQYFYQLKTGNVVIAKKMLIIK